MNANTLAIGQSLKNIQIGECAVLSFSPAGIVVYIGMGNPSSLEEKCFKSESEFTVHYCKYERIGALIYDFGNGIRFDTTFDAGIENPSNIPDYDLIANECGITITLVGIDIANKNRVFGLRFVSLPENISKKIVEKIQEQVKNPCDAETSKASVNRLYQSFSTIQSLKGIALAKCSFGKK